MSKFNRIIVAVATIAACLSLAGEAAGRDRGAGPRFSFAPYLWFTDYSGSVHSRGERYDLDTDFLNLSQSMAGFLYIQATWQERFALLFDHNYRRWDIKSGEAGNVNKASGWMYTTQLAAAYALTEDKPVVPELIIGGRINHLSSKVVDSARVSDERTRTWFDPFIGLRTTAPLGPRFFVSARGDIGGILTGSKSNWSVSGLLGYRIGYIASIGAGYRIYDVRYETGEGDDLFEYDVQSHGPFLGMEFYF